MKGHIFVIPCFPTVLGILTLALASCASPPPQQFEGNNYSRLHADWVPAHARRLAQVIEFATQEEIEKLQIKESGEIAYDNLRQSGISDSEIVNGSLAAGIVVCCGGGITKESVVIFYVPDPTSINVGDIVEIEVGDPETLDFPNTLRSVRHRNGESGRCDWYPKNPNLWLRVLYCEGLESEGWKQQTGEPSFWFKPAVSP